MGSISRKEPEEDPRSGAERRSGGGMREGMHRGNLLIRFPLSFRVVMIQEPQTANLQRKSIVPVSQSVYSMHHNQLPKFD